MKAYALIILGLLAASSAFASPSVGDSTELVGLIQNTPAIITLSLSNFNAATGQFEQRTVVTVTAGQPHESVKWVNGSSLATDAQLDYVLANCPSRGGVSERVQVPGGTFDTCKLPQQNGGYAWLGQVPFGIVKMDATLENGYHWQVELRKYARGH